MREILFRGKRLKDGAWIEGFYCEFANNRSGEQEHFIQTVKPDGRIDVLYHVDPSTVGQYTGLTDKNGKRIFEGDIVECWSEGVKAKGTVQQRKDGLWIIYPAWQKTIMWGLCPDEYCHTIVEIIGNIYDNPELLEGGTDNA